MIVFKPTAAALLASLLVFYVTSVQAVTITSQASGNWSAPATWDLGRAPISSDDVIIANGDVVTYNALHPSGDENETVLSLTVNGTLNFPFAATADDPDLDDVFILRVTGTTTISGTGTIGVDDTYTTGADRTHQLNIEGTFSNAGTLDLVASSTRRVDTDFQTNTFSVTGAGSFTFWNIDVDNGGVVTFTASNMTVDNTIDVLANSTLINNGTNLIVGPDVTGAFELAGDNAVFTLTSGNVDIAGNMSTNNATAFSVDADNCILNVDGGTLDIGDITTNGRGRLRIDDDAVTSFNFDIDGGTTNIADYIDYQSATATMTLNISAGTLNVSTGDLGDETNSEILNGSIVVDGASAVLNFGENVNIDVVPTIDNGATFSVGTNATQTANFLIDGAWVIAGGSTFTADAGLDVNATFSLTVQESSIVNVESNNTSYPQADFQVFGTVTVATGTINVGGAVVNAGTVTNDGIQIENAGVFNLNDGTVNIFNNAGLTDGSIFTSQGLQLVGATSGTLNIGDGTGSANSAVMNIATNLASQAPPTEEDLFVNSTDDGQTVVDSDGTLNIGGGNVGSLLLDDDDGSTDVDFHFVVQGGTVEVAGTLDIDEGAGFQMTSGTVNVGTAASSGVNDLELGGNDPTSPAIFEVTGGTFSVGDGSMSIVIGDNDNPAAAAANPSHGLTTAYHEMDIRGGTVNIRGRLLFRDENARLILGGGATINFDPQAVNNLNEDRDVLFLQNGIVDIQGPVNINFLNPHAVSGTGHTLEIQGVGAGRNLLTSSTSTGVGAAIDFSNVTWGFGDGSESKDGADGFDLDLATGHTSYGNFVVNNPSGNNRKVLFNTNNNSYLTENITITAGEFDVATNNLDDDGSGSTFIIGANGTLLLDTDFPGTSSASYSTYTVSSGSTVNFNGSATVANAQPPSGTALDNLVVSGTGTKTISSAISVNGTITLTSGTLAAGTNITFAGPTISRSAGAMTGDIQGTADYVIEYTGLSKSIDDTSDPEWTGGGAFGLTVNLDASETLTIVGSQLSVNDLIVTEGILTDASAGFTHAVAGNLTMNTSYTGLGTISITGGTTTHALSTTGTATISNLTMNDASFDASGDLDMTITGTLTLTAGDLQVSQGTFTMNSGATVSGGSSSSYIAFDGTNSAGGMKQTYTSATDSKTFPIGTTTEYTPGTITLTAASGFGELTMIPVASGTPFTLDGSNILDLNYHWIVTTDGGFSGITADHTYNYDESDVRGVEGSYLSARYNVSSPAWSNSDDTASGADGVNTTSNTITLTGVDFVEGHLTAGEVDEFSGVITTFYLRSDLGEPLDWNDGTNWTSTDGGTIPINRTPGTNSPVVIKRSVNIDTDSQSAGSINIDAAGTMILNENGSNTPSSGHTFGTVSGTGTLRIISDDTDNPTFPDQNGGNWTSFLGASGGTVEYSGDGSYTLPGDVSSYYNLAITSSNLTCSCTKTLGDVDLTIHNNFSVTGANTTTAAFSDATNGDITIGGDVLIEATNTLSYGSTNARTVAVTDDFTVSTTSNFNVSNSGSAAHSLSIGGSLSSVGTTDMNTGGSTVDVTFTGTGNETISGAGSVDFNRLIVNKGTSQAATLEATITTMTVTDTGSGTSSTSIDLQNGTLILSTGGTHTINSNGDWTIPATAKLDMNSGSPTLQVTTSSAGSFFLNGSIQISSGILDIGNQTDNSTDNSIRYDGTTAEIIVDGGILNVGGAIRPNVTDASAALDFTLSSGTVSLARNTSTNSINVNNSSNRSDADFSLDNAGSSFTMSGGALEIVRAQSSDGAAISIHSNVTTYTVTGGTVSVMVNAHDAFSSNSTNQGNDIGIYSNVPFWNLQVGDGDFPGDVGNGNSSTSLTLSVLNDFTLNLDNASANEGNFDLFLASAAPSGNTDGMDMTVGGSFTITDGTWEVNNDGTFGTVTFNGSGLSGQTSPQLINTNGETLGDVTINSTSGSVQLSAPLTISGDWTYTAGTFNQSSNLVTMTTPGTPAGTTINGSPSFDDITLSNTSDVTLSGGDMTIVSGGVLTISDDVILDIGDNGLIISEQSAGGITFSTTADNTNMIRVSGSELANGITRTYPDATTTNFIYPVGATVSATDYYMPGQIDLTAGGGAGSTATVVLVTSQHPQVTASQNALNVYWKVTETGFDDTQTADHTYTYGSDVADIVEGADDTNFLDAFNVGTPTFAWTEGSTTNVTEFDLGSGGTVAFSDPGTDNIVGEFTAGVDAAFNSVTVFYTLRNGDWNNTTAGNTPWTNDVCGGGQTEVTGIQPGSTNPVVICSSETVTITSTTGLNASAVEISGQITSQVADISTIGNIDGTGTILFSHTSTTTPSFGTLSATFVGASGGTINYGGTSAYTLPTNTTYNDLTISNSATITLGANVSVNGSASFTGSAVDMGGFTLSDADNGGTFTLGSGTSLDVDAANNFPDNFNTYTLNSTSTVDYSLDNSSVQTVLGGITYGNLTLSRTAGNPAQKSLTTDVTIAGNLDIGLRTELLSNNHTITLQGNWDRSNNGNTNFDEGTGTVILSGGSNQTIDMSGSDSETFYNLTINKSGGTTVDFGSNVSAITVTNDLTVTAETLAMGTVPLTVNGNFSTGASGTFTSSVAPDLNGNLTNAGTFTVPASVNLAGNFSNTGTYTNTSNTLVFDNTSTAQSLGGNATTFNNITVAKASGVDLTVNAATTVNGILALQNLGNVILSSGNLTIPVGGSITGSGGGTTATDFGATRMIRTGGGGSDPYLVKNADTDADWDFVFPIGVDDSGNKYTPVTVDATTDNITAGTLSVRSIDGTSTDQSISGSATTLNRHFDFDITGLTGAVTFDVIFEYDDTDVQGTEGDYLSAYSERGTDDGWNQPVASMANTNAATNVFGASASLSGTVSFSSDINTEWISGDTDLIFPHFYTRAGGSVDCGAVTCDWNDGTNWTLSDGGTTSAGATPASDNLVTISSGHSMAMDNNINTASSTEVLGTLDIAATTGHTLGDLTGTGTLQIESNALDTYVNTTAASTFFSASGGTVEYGGTSAYTLPAAITEYNNLTIIDGTQDTHDKTLGVNTTVLGDLTVNTVDLENTSNFDLELRGSFSSASGGRVQLANGTFVWANTATASLSSNLVFGASGSITLDNFGEKDLAGTLSVSNLTINSGSGTFDANSNAINLTGSWDNKSSSNKLTSPGTTTFNGGGAQAIDGDNTFGTTNVSTSSTAVTVNTGTQTFTGVITLASGTTLDIGSNTIRVGNTLDVDAGTFTASSGTIVYTSVTDPESQTDAITVGTLEIDKGGSTNTFDNDPATVTFTNLVLTNGEYDGPDADLTLNGDLTITPNGAIVTTGISTLDINGSFSNAATLNLSGVTTMNIAGDFTNTGTFTPPTTINMDGASAQQLNNALSVTNFTKSGGGDLTLNDDLTVTTALTLTSGDIISTSTNLLSLSATAGNPTGSAASHVVGAMLHTTPAVTTLTTKIYPLGDGTNFRPVELDLTQASTTSRTYTADLMSGASASRIKPVGLNHVSNVRHYNITQSPTEALTAGAVRITYGADDQVLNTGTLLIAKDNGAGNWLDLGGSVTGTAAAGTIESTTNFTSFSDFLLASSSMEASLPVDLVAFDASYINEKVALTWSTASEVNNAYFEIQRSKDAQEFNTIGSIDGAGNSNRFLEYTFTDNTPHSGISYYRLKQVDFDGQFEYSPVRMVQENLLLNLMEVTLFPNPSKDRNIKLQLSSFDEESDVQFTIFDYSGHLIYSKVFEVNVSNNQYEIQLPPNTSGGVFLVQVNQGTLIQNTKFMLY